MPSYLHPLRWQKTGMLVEQQMQGVPILVEQRSVFETGDHA